MGVPRIANDEQNTTSDENRVGFPPERRNICPTFAANASLVNGGDMNGDIFDGPLAITTSANLVRHSTPHVSGKRRAQESSTTPLQAGCLRIKALSRSAQHAASHRVGTLCLTLVHVVSHVGGKVEQLLSTACTTAAAEQRKRNISIIVG